MADEGKISKCESCGEQFGCGVNIDNCWCTQLQLPDEIAAHLQSKYTDCLCPDCLRKLVSMPLIIVTYPSGQTEVIAEAVRVDTQNFHEGMFDFYDKRGNLLKQISMHSDIKWDCVSANKTGG